MFYSWYTFQLLVLLIYVQPYLIVIMQIDVDEIDSESERYVEPEITAHLSSV